MARKFHDYKSIFIEASPPHPGKTGYRVSIGLEEVQGNNVKALKIQLTENDRIVGQKAPFFPLENGDLQEILEAINQLMNIDF